MHLLLGNHEIWNLGGFYKDVAKAVKQDPVRFKAHKDAFLPNGELGFLYQRPMVAKIGKTVFVHGGILPEFAEGGVDAINAAVLATLHDYTVVRRQPSKLPKGQKPYEIDPKWRMYQKEGPVWYRGYAQDPENTVCPILESALEKLGAERMVVGHTPQSDGLVKVRCGGRVVLTDVKISSAMTRGGNTAALELWNDEHGVATEAWGLYSGARVALQVPPPIVVPVHNVQVVPNPKVLVHDVVPNRSPQQDHDAHPPKVVPDHNVVPHSVVQDHPLPDHKL